MLVELTADMKSFIRLSGTLYWALGRRTEEESTRGNGGISEEETVSLKSKF